MDVVSYKCPNCAAPLAFDIDSQAWSCDFCSSTFSLSDLEQEEKPAADPSWREVDSTPEHEYGADAAVYECPSCGGRIITDKNTAATFCIYCHNPTVIASKLKEEHRPQYLIPFKLQKDEAVTAVQKLCKGKPLLPKAFKESVHNGEVEGLYVPFWLFSCKADAGLYGEGRRITTWRDSNYRYTKTDTYAVVREADMAFRHVPADGSSRMDDTLMESLEPFDYGQMQDFSMGYLSGHFADSFDVSKEDCAKRVGPRIRKGVEDIIRGTVKGYNSFHAQNLKVRLSDDDCRYAMLPVWTLMYDFKGKKYVFAMNGQTGKMVGKLPISWPRLAAIFGTVWAAALAILMLVVIFG